MDGASVVRLILLAAIWGASFLFMRIAAPELGAALVAEVRVLLAAMFLWAVSVFFKRSLRVGENWRHFLIVGFFNSALPFILFSYAALQLSASILSILNATAPLWGCVIAAALDRQRIPVKTFSGLVLGVIGVGVLLGFDAAVVSEAGWLPCLAAIGAAFCYGIASNYTRRAKAIDAFSNAHGTMWSSTLILLPMVILFSSTEQVTVITEGAVLMSVTALGVICTGIAYLLYFRLIKDVGAASALTVTFLIPVFGVLWGGLFLNENMGWHTFGGGVIVVLGTMLVTGFSPKSLFKNRSAHV